MSGVGISEDRLEAWLQKRIGPKPKKQPKRRRVDGLFVPPIPLDWYRRSVEVGGLSAAAVVCMLHFGERTLGSPVQINAKLRDQFGVHRNTSTRVLDKMEQAGLIKVDRRVGCNFRVTLLESVE